MTLKLSANDTLQHSNFTLCGMDMITLVLRLSIKRYLARNYKTSQTSNISFGGCGRKQLVSHLLSSKVITEFSALGKHNERFLGIFKAIIR